MTAVLAESAIFDEIGVEKNLIFLDPDFVENGTFSLNGRHNRTSRSQLCPFSSIKPRFALTATRFVKNPSQKPEILTISRRPKKIIVKTVGQNFKNRPPVAPNQFLDPPYRTAASPRLRFTPPNIPKASPKSSFDHRYIIQLFQFLFWKNQRFC